MQIKYFQTAWNDIKNSPGWFGKLCLLALISFIPIFGQIVVFGYLYGWARQIAWGAHVPMPASIFANEDGKFWRRGVFIFVISFVFTLIPTIIMQVGLSMQGTDLYSTLYNLNGNGAVAGVASAASSASVAGGWALYMVGLLLTVVIEVIAWIAYMRTSIYDSLSAGFQFGKLWKMLRKDTSGILKIFGMNLLVGLIIGAIATVVISVITVVFVLVGIGGAASSQSGGAAASIMLSFGGIFMVLLMVAIYFVVVGSMFVETLTARAMGYWTMQFDVPNWRGQDDPMPFETMPPSTPTYPVQ